MLKAPFTSAINKYSYNWAFGLVLLSIGLLVLRLVLQGTGLLSNSAPYSAYEYTLRLNWDDANKPIALSTFLPESNERQFVISEASSAPYLNQTQYSSNQGLVTHWSGEAKSGSIVYQALISTRSVSFVIPESLNLSSVSSDEWSLYLEASDSIEVNAPAISAAWAQIKPAHQTNTLEVLKRIYDFSANLPAASDDPLHSASAALAGLPSGPSAKSRVFVALARHVGLPSRLVGGVILDPKHGHIAHKWLEVNVNNQWVPFDPSKRFFAHLPANYLNLFWGDHTLFSGASKALIDVHATVKHKQIAPIVYDTQHTVDALSWATISLLKTLNISPQTASILLLLPFCTLLISALRNVIGLSSFGTFMPMLIGSACVFMGPVLGLAGFCTIIIIATLASALTSRLALLKIPRLAIVVTITNLATIGLLSLVRDISPVDIGVMSLFPVIIVAFIADKLFDMKKSGQWRSILSTTMGTLSIIVMCFVALSSSILQTAFALLPELYFLVLGGLIHVGSWTGIRMSEIWRFKSLLLLGENVLSINARNRNLVGRLNSQKALRMANDKLKTKMALNSKGIPVPGTLAIFDEAHDLNKLSLILEGHQRFVIKPNKGSQGRGILVLTQLNATQFVAANGQTYDTQDLQQHIKDIIGGTYSANGEGDVAYIEPLIEQNVGLNALAPFGLADIRILVLEGKAIAAMLRLPTKVSNGKANLHQGALGAAIDLKTGAIIRATKKGQSFSHHPDSNQALIGVTLPYWQNIIQIAEKCYESIDLGYMGVDVCLDKNLGPLVLEVNGRPGLEIQNVQQKGLNCQPTVLQTAINRG